MDEGSKGALWRLLDAEANSGMRITEPFVTRPGSSLGGLYFARLGLWPDDLVPPP